MKQIYFFITLLSISFIGFGQTPLVTYDFTGQPGTQRSQPIVTADANISASSIGRGALTTGATLTNAMASASWPGGNNPGVDNYFEFSITPDEGYFVTLGTLTLGDESVNTGAREFAIRTNLDGFTNNIFTGTMPNGSRSDDWNIDLSTISSGTTITIRIYGYRAQGGGGRIWGIKNNSTTNNMSLTGIVEQRYCTSTFPFNDPDAITNVTLNTLNNTSGDAHVANPNGYQDFTALTPTDLEQGSNYSLSVSIDPGGMFLYNVSVFFDWDGNFSFNNLIDERYDLGSLSEAGTLTTNIMVPLGAVLGNTRMRVVMIFEEIASACDPQASVFGETEDYTVNVVGPTTYVFENNWTPTNPEGQSNINNPLQIVAGDYTFTANVDCESITVAPGSTITVNNGVIITADNGVTLQSVSNSYSGLILNGAINGTVNYSRYVNVIGSGTTGGNDLVTPPLNGQTFGNFAAANDGVLAASGDIRAWAPFNNASGAYENYNIVDNSTTPLQTGTGFRAATVGGANLLFSGTVNNTNFNASITNETGTFGQWNAIGNPYPSYIDIDAFLNHTVSGLANIDKLAADAQAIYGYDGSATDGWDVINLANAPGRLMAPGQGFFVAADTGGAFLRFTPAMRTTGSGDDFILGRTQPLTFLKLNATNGSQTYNTDIYFNDNGSLGFDPGYDAKLWGGDTSGFKLYSHVVENNTGIALALQSLNTNSLSGVVIPLGINSGAGTTLTFSLQDFNLPGTVQVYLEDAANNTITRIDNNNHSVTLNQPVNGTGRFFLRLTDSTLGLDDQTSSSINIYHQAADEVIVIAGAILNNTPAYLYDLQGRVVSTTALNASQSEQRIDVSGLSTGIYVLSFENGDSRISKKLIIK